MTTQLDTTPDADPIPPDPLHHDPVAAPTAAGLGEQAPAERRGWVKGAAAGAAVACGCAAIALVDPTDSGVPVCWSAGIFGVDCPLCGGLRCTNSLVRGDWLAAADHNVLLAVALPAVAVAWVVWMVAALRGRPAPWPKVPAWAWWTLGVVTLAFTVVRNLDLGPVAHYLAATQG